MRMNQPSTMWGAAAALCLVTGSVTASAQEEMAEADEAMEEEAPVEDEGEPEEAVEEEPEDTDDEAAADDEDGGEGRFRWGIAGLGGPYMGSHKGGAGGLDLRFGWQLDDNIGIVAQPFLALGFGAQADGDSASVSATALSGVSVVADYTMADFFYFGGGLGFSTGGFGSLGADSASGEAKGASGPFLDIPLRVGIALGGKEQNRRKAFTIGINGHVLVVQNTTTTVDSTTSESSTEKKLGLVFLPLIALGYESF